MEKLERLPQHVSLIMDGNGRWARQRGKERVYGHYEGVSSVRAVMEASVEWGIRYTSFFAFSEENWDRPSDEVQALMELMGAMMERELPTFMDNDIRFLVLGNRDRLSDKLKASIDSVMDKTAANGGMTMILFLSYSGKWDIWQAAVRMAHDLIENPGREPGMEDFSRYLVTAGITTCSGSRHIPNSSSPTRSGLTSGRSSTERRSRSTRRGTGASEKSNNYYICKPL